MKDSQPLGADREHVQPVQEESIKDLVKAWFEDLAKDNELEPTIPKVVIDTVVSVLEIQRDRLLEEAIKVDRCGTGGNFITLVEFYDIRKKYLKKTFPNKRPRNIESIALRELAGEMAGAIVERTLRAEGNSDLSISYPRGKAVDATKALY